MATTSDYDNVWYLWTSSTSTSTATATTGGNDYIWSQWVTSTSTTTTSTASDDTWYYWTVKPQQSERPDSIDLAEWDRRQDEMAEERRRQREEDNRRQQAAIDRQQALEKKRKAAEEKAKQLLMDLIGEKELEVYKETGRLFVKGRKHDYIVQKNGFVKMLEKDRVVDLCVHLENRHGFPETDNVVALALALEADEEQVLELANRHGERARADDPALVRAACM